MHHMCASVFESGAGFYGAERAYQSAFHLLFRRDFPRQSFFVRRRVAQKWRRQSLPLKRADAPLFHPLTHMLHAIQIILEKDFVLPKILLHPLRHHRLELLIPVAVVQAPQRTPENQPVKAAQRPVDLLPILVAKILHGVLLVPSVLLIWNFKNTLVQTGTPPPNE